MREGHNGSFPAVRHREPYRALALGTTILPRLCPALRPPLASAESVSLALLFCYLSHGFCHSSWKQAAVGGAEQLSISPRERRRSAIHLACVEAPSVWLYVRHLHPRAVGAAPRAPCPIPRSHISNHLPQDSSLACRSASGRPDA